MSRNGRLLSYAMLAILIAGCNGVGGSLTGTGFTPNVIYGIVLAPVRLPEAKRTFVVFQSATSSETCDYADAGFATPGVLSGQLVIELHTQDAGAPSPGIFPLGPPMNAGEFAEITLFGATDPPSSIGRVVGVGSSGSVELDDIAFDGRGGRWRGTFQAQMELVDGGASSISGSFDTNDYCAGEVLGW